MKARFAKVHYGWYIVVASFLILLFNSGARYVFGVAFKSMGSEFGWGRAALSGVFSVNMALFAVALLFTGKLYDKYGPKGVLTVSSFLLSLGFVGTALSHGFWSFLVFYGVISALGFSGPSIPLVSTLVSKWFHEKKGLAVSVALSGGALGQFLLSPLSGALVEAYGWRVCFTAIGLLTLLVNLPLIFLVIKGDPHELEVEPYGTMVQQEGPKPGGGVSLSQALRTTSLWAFMAMMFICGAGDFFSTTHLVPMATDQGISTLKASMMLGWYGLLSLGGLLAAGPAADALGCRLPIMATFGIRVLTFLILMSEKSYWSFLLFSLLFGFTHLVTAPLTPVLASKLYGTRNLGVITGLINTLHFLGGSLMAYLGGLIFDRTQSYQLALVIMALASATAVLWAYLIKEEKDSNRR